MPPKKTVKSSESVNKGKRGVGGAATTTEDIMDAVEVMKEETSRLQKAPPASKKRSAADASAAAESDGAGGVEESSTVKKKRAGGKNKSVTVESSNTTVTGGKKKATVSRSASSVTASSKAAKDIAEKMSRTTAEVNGKAGATKTLKRNISVRGRKKKESEPEDDDEEDLLEAANNSKLDAKTAKALVMKNKGKNNKTVQEVLIEEDEDEMEMDVAEETTAAGEKSDTNNNKKGAKRKINETTSAAAASSTSVRRGVSFKQPKITAQPVHDRGVGTVYTFGKGDMGQLGLGASVEKRNYPCLVDDLKDLKVVQVVAGGLHTVILDESGSVWTFGCNDDKALGRVTDDEEDNFIPGKVELSKKVVQVSAGDSHTAVLTEEGDVYAWGTFKDSNGNIGLVPGEGEMCRVEAQLMSATLPSKVKKICSGDHHLVMLTLDGKIYTCGNGEMGQLGREFENQERRATRLSSVVPVLSTKDLMLKPTEVRCKSKFVDIWTGSFSTYASASVRKATSDIWVFGLNGQGQLGMKPAGDETVIKLPTKSSGFAGKKWKQIAGGQHHAVALDSEGQVYTLGRGDDGRLGLGDSDTEDKHEPTEVPGLRSQKCVQVSAGLSTGYALNSEGKVYSWGCGVNFQLGNGKSDEAMEPIEIEHMVEEKKKLDLEGKIKYISGGGQHVALTLTKDSSPPPAQDKMETD